MKPISIIVEYHLILDFKLACIKLKSNSLKCRLKKSCVYKKALRKPR